MKISENGTVELLLEHNCYFSSREVAEVAGLTSYSFGEEDFDRYTMLFKKESPPTEDEIAAYKRGEEYDEEAAKLLAEQVHCNYENTQF